jgi:hypothetical protein
MQTTNQTFKKARLTTTLEVGFLLLLSTLSLAQPSNRQTFPSAEKASTALFAAVEGDNEDAIEQVLGCDKNLVSSGDGLADRQDRQMFVEKYRQMHRIVQEPDGTWMLYIGAENWPFPVPLVSKNDKWFFDADTGKQEVLFRRIGENEASSLQTCAAFSAGDQPPSDVLNGYYFRKLTEEGKHGVKQVILIAYPAEYRSSGVMTFAVTASHVVYEKDLGPQTDSVAKTANSLSVDHSWRKAE